MFKSKSKLFSKVENLLESYKIRVAIVFYKMQNGRVQIETSARVIQN